MQRYGEALAIAHARGMRPLEGLARLGLGRLRAARGDLDAARALLTELGMTRWIQVPEASGR